LITLQKIFTAKLADKVARVEMYSCALRNPEAERSTVDNVSRGKI
jgi:hypothetical protein